MNRSGMACMRRPFPMGENDTLKIAVCRARVKREHGDRQTGIAAMSNDYCIAVLR